MGGWEGEECEDNDSYVNIIYETEIEIEIECAFKRSVCMAI